VCVSALVCSHEKPASSNVKIVTNTYHNSLPNQYNLKEKGCKCPRLHNLHNISVLIRLATQFFLFLRLEYVRTGFNFCVTSELHR